MYFKHKKPLKNYNSKQVTLNPKRSQFSPNTPCRMLICGPSGCGKTNVLLNLIYDLLPWSTLYVYAKDLTEHKYAELHNVCELASKVSAFQYVFDSDNIVDVDDLDSSEHNLIVFDDFVTDKKSIESISSLFIRGRKKNATIIYLTQSYFATPKIIRLQCNNFLLFKPSDEREIGELYRNHSCGLSKEDFHAMFHEATDDPFTFLYLDINNPDKALRCRKNFSGTLLLK